MERNGRNPHSHEKETSTGSTSANEEKRPTERDLSTSEFVNKAAMAWHERRREWVGDQSQKPRRVSNDPIISWSISYDELLSTNEPFPERIPLPEMVDFLVDIWSDEGLYE